MIQSTPFDFMHLMFENNVPNLMKIWMGTYKNLDEDKGSYVIESGIWETIGKEMVASNKTIPAAFNRSMPNITTNMSDFTAESWSWWICYLAPILLRGRLDDIYYQHLLELRDIILICLQFEITYNKVDEL
ncbi:hypothetical protein FRC03_000179 [Tulasnella sp. 419]|nr:hypothetical protein FRC02_007939 [Tulasnella sp. 418]KAG8950054.1 hypothetical protein FRC03_000179 [Tulasnella sp. 419]